NDSTFLQYIECLAPKLDASISRRSCVEKYRQVQCQSFFSLIEFESVAAFELCRCRSPTAGKRVYVTIAIPVEPRHDRGELRAKMRIQIDKDTRRASRSGR